MDGERVKELIIGAFSSNERPGDWALVDSSEGDEPGLLVADFRDTPDWQSLDAALLDQAPNGYAAALSFFSDEAFRYFLPVYLLAAIRSSAVRDGSSRPIASRRTCDGVPRGG